MNDTSDFLSRLNETARFLEARWGRPPRVSLVLGSGLGGLEPAAGDRVPYRSVPHFGALTVTGHSGALIVDPASGVACLSGRMHPYEGLSLQETTFTVQALARWGVDVFILTNAAGGINVDLGPGDLMMISDHINLMGESPLAGPPIPELGSRFIDLTDAYSRSLRKLTWRCARRLGIPIAQGVYAAVRGPNYETPAEIRLLRHLGADAVGMSTVPEVIALRRMQRRVLAFSCITNLAAGTLAASLDHLDVLQQAQNCESRLGRLLEAVVVALRDGEEEEK